MANDMLVKLYDLPDFTKVFDRIKQGGYRLQRAHPCDRNRVIEEVRAHFPYWVNECEAAFSKENPSIYIAVKDHEMVGFGCYNATAKGFFGPVGVWEEHRGHAIGMGILAKCMQALESEGYVYAIIGWTEILEYYEKACNAITIPDSFPGGYGRMIALDPHKAE
ncbi:MAG: GNAT family N-acetyltransferase [Oscillospiraceae bacterium]|nr:GNAT family N-acetyltransferase [Oscillospiraceae bacterium]